MTFDVSEALNKVLLSLLGYGAPFKELVEVLCKCQLYFICRTEAFSEAEMMRLWKGLYYCFWMSDKPLVQEELAESISSFIKCFHSQDSSLLFIQSFLQTFGREWFGIDRSER